MDNTLLEVYNEIKDGCIAVLLTGSAVLPYIKHPYDKDYIFLYKDEASAKIAEEKLLKKYSWLELKTKFDWDIHIRFGEDTEYYGLGNYIKVIKGDPAVISKLPKILENKEFYKDRCLNIYKRQKDLLASFPTMAWYTRKTWYYLYRIVNVINNNSYELTEKQIEEINILHDKDTTVNERKPIVDRLVEEIELWQI